MRPGLLSQNDISNLGASDVKIGKVRNGITHLKSCINLDLL